MYRCRLIDEQSGRPRDVPQWMFDAATCCSMKACAEPHVTIEALRRLAKLLSEQGDGEDNLMDDSVLEDRRSRSHQGDADVQATIQANRTSSVEPVRPSTDRSELDQPSARDEAGD